VADLKGNIIKQLTNKKGYGAKPTVSPKGYKIVFTSNRYNVGGRYTNLFTAKWQDYFFSKRSRSFNSFIRSLVSSVVLPNL